MDFLKFSKMNKKAVQEVNQLKNKIKRRKNVLLFLNTNSLMSTKKVKKYGEKAHTHKAKRLMRDDRLTYLDYRAPQANKMIWEKKN